MEKFCTDWFGWGLFFAGAGLSLADFIQSDSAPVARLSPAPWAVSVARLHFNYTRCCVLIEAGIISLITTTSALAFFNLTTDFYTVLPLYNISNFFANDSSQLKITSDCRLGQLKMSAKCQLKDTARAVRVCGSNSWERERKIDLKNHTWKLTTQFWYQLSHTKKWYLSGNFSCFYGN